jgi:hypothetical protein
LSISKKNSEFFKNSVFFFEKLKKNDNSAL